jgi:predicted MFS family arabinose efflux permease
MFRLSPSNPLHQPGYRYFLVFAVCSAMGGGFHFVAGYWLLYNDTHSPTSVAWLILAFWMPSLLVLPLGGVLVDRWNRRRLLAVLYGYLALVNAGLIALLATGVFQPNHLYVYGVLSSFAQALIWTTLTAYLQHVLKSEELLHANSLNVALFQGGYLLGAGAAGVLYNVLGATGCFAVDLAGCLVAMVGWLTIHRWFSDRDAGVERVAHRGVWADFVDGLRYVRADLPLFAFALFMLVPRLAAQVVNVLHVGFSADVLRTGAEGFGLMDMAYGLGAMASGLLFPVLAERRGMSPHLPWITLTIAAGCLFAISYANDLAGAMVALAVLGGASNIVGVLARTLLQREAAGQLIGRFTSTVQIFQYLLIPPLVWAIGNYASRSKGLALHSDPLRDAFVLGALVFAMVAALGHLAMAPLIRERWQVRG